ncbi:hypothetical protein [Desertivirga brevis]|uniref:hypothetical protein n=1 Tax=Desertivirga brevis TaxID=2810310 RepID=UPI001A97330F|nr:hypothetical protein [Pedobacter sp. SYSU D00873]
MLRESTIKYYQGLLRLKKIDILEAQMEALRLEVNSGSREKTINDIANLARKRLELHRNIGKFDEERWNARKNFEKVNDLD